MNVRRVAWHPDQIYPYESIWGMLHKLCRWNRIHFVDVWRLVAVRSRAMEARLATSRVANALIDPTWLDRAELRRLLNLSESCAADAFLDRYTCLAGLEDVSQWGLIGLQYCPDCLGLGFHSSLHNLPYLIRCPIHRRPLLNGCPCCARPIRYTAPKADPFCCPCGHPLWLGTTCSPLAPAEEQALRETVGSIDLVRNGSFGSGSPHERVKPAIIGNALIEQAFGIYRQLRERIKKVVRESEDDSAASQSSTFKGQAAAALYTWRCFWEGSEDGNTTDTARVPASVAARFVAIFTASVSQLNKHQVERLMVGACQGAFAEIWENTSAIDDFDKAGRLVGRLEGKYVPFCVAESGDVRSIPDDREGRLVPGTYALKTFFDATNSLT